MAYTGGELNQLNGKYGISAPHKSVPVMKLIRQHRPRSRDELVELIRFHYENECPCGIRSQGVVEDFGKNLYAAQIKEWGIARYTLQECIQWEYDLFILQSLKGTKVESQALEILQKVLVVLHLSVAEAQGFVDEELRVDLIVSKEGQPLCGIQVKPLTFNKMRLNVISFNKKANAKWGLPVFYLFYDEVEYFTNTDDVVSAIVGLC
jgi:hypothetical protein